MPLQILANFRRYGIATSVDIYRAYLRVHLKQCDIICCSQFTDKEKFTGEEYTG